MMARCFQTEKSRIGVLGQSLFNTEEAEFLGDSLTARKWSLFPIGNFYIILCIFNGNMISKHKIIFVFRSMMKMTMTIMKKKITKKMKKIKKLKSMKKNEDEDANK